MAKKYLDSAGLSTVWTKIKNDISLKQDKQKIENVSGTNITKEILPNIYYIFETVKSLTITLNTSNNGQYEEFYFEFNSGATPTSLSLPITVKWEVGKGQIKIQANHKYAVSIVNNLAVWGEFSNALVSPIKYTADSDKRGITMLSLNGTSILDKDSFEYSVGDTITYFGIDSGGSGSSGTVSVALYYKDGTSYQGYDSFMYVESVTIEKELNYIEVKVIYRSGEN